MSFAEKSVKVAEPTMILVRLGNGVVIVIKFNSMNHFVSTEKTLSFQEGSYATSKSTKSKDDSAGDANSSTPPQTGRRGALGVTCYTPILDHDLDFGPFLERATPTSNLP